MRPDEVRLRFVGDWLQHADTDLRAARLLLPHGHVFFDICGFHAQQAAEKYLKAFLVRHQVEFPAIHGIRRLLIRVARVDPMLAQALRTADVLTPYAVDARYPGGSPEPDEAEAKRLLGQAAIVEQRVLTALSPYLEGSTR